MNMQFQDSDAQSSGFQSGEDAAVEPKQGGWLKWLLLIMAVLIVAAGFFYWIFAP